MASSEPYVKNFNPPEESKPQYKEYKIKDLVSMIDNGISEKRYSLSFELGGQRNIHGENIWGVKRCQDLIYSMCDKKYIDSPSINKETKEPFRSYVIDGCNRIRCIYWFVKGSFPDGKEFQVKTKGRAKSLAFKDWEANDAEDFLESTIAVRETTDWPMEACIDYFLNLHKGVSMTKGEKLYATYCFAQKDIPAARVVCKVFENSEEFLKEIYEEMHITRGLIRNIIFEDLARYLYIFLNERPGAYAKSTCQLHRLKDATEDQMIMYKETVCTFSNVIHNARAQGIVDKFSFTRPRAMLAIFFAYCVKHVKYKHRHNDTSFQALINATKNLQEEKWTTLMNEQGHQNGGRWINETYQYVERLLSPIRTTGASMTETASSSTTTTQRATVAAPIFHIKRKRPVSKNHTVSKKKIKFRI